MTHSLAGYMLLSVCKMEFYENLFEENIDEIAFFCVILILMRVAFADFLSTATVMATKEVSSCVIQ